VQGLLTEREREAADKDAELAALRQHLLHLLSLPERDARQPHHARLGHDGGPGAGHESLARIAELEVRGA
jgi:hypothetical protein